MATTHNPIKVCVDKESSDQYWIICEGCAARWAGPYVTAIRATEVAEGMNRDPRYQVPRVLRNGICCELIPYGVDRTDSYRVVKGSWRLTKTDVKVILHLFALAMFGIAILFCFLGFYLGGGWLTIGSTLLPISIILGMICVLVGDGSEDELTSDVYTRHRIE